MVTIAKVKTDQPVKRMRPALNPQNREDQLISMAVDRAEQQLRDGTASSQVITHFLKLGSSKERLEKDILEKKKELMAAQTKAIESSENAEKRYKEAIEAMRSYKSSEGDEYDD